MRAGEGGAFGQTNPTVILAKRTQAVRNARPHPEERAYRRRAANSKARARVSKDEDGHGAPSCFETPRLSALNICVRGRKARLLSMRAGEGSAFWPNEANAPRFSWQRADGPAEV